MVEFLAGGAGEAGEGEAGEDEDGGLDFLASLGVGERSMDAEGLDFSFMLNEDCGKPHPPRSASNGPCPTIPSWPWSADVGWDCAGDSPLARLLHLGGGGGGGVGEEEVESGQAAGGIDLDAFGLGDLFND